METPPLPQPVANEVAILPNTSVTREEALHTLLGADYDYARESGLVDMFYYNPETGEDGLIHTLSGNIIVHSSGAKEIAGFHHEPSALTPDTFVDLEPLKSKNSKAMREYRRYPYEPYNAFTVIQNYPKLVLHRDETGGEHMKAAHSSMYPSQYDALAVMQAIRIARDSRDRKNDTLNRNNSIVADSEAPLLDGQNTMKLRLILDRDTEQVITAFPIARRNGVMKLNQEAIKQHLGLEIK